MRLRLGKRGKNKRGMLPAIFQRSFVRSSLPERYAHLEQGRYRAAVQKYEGKSWQAFGVTVHRRATLNGGERKIFLFGFEFSKREPLPYKPLTQYQILRFRVGEFFGIPPKTPQVTSVPLRREFRNIDPGKGVIIRARDARAHAKRTVIQRLVSWRETRIQRRLQVSPHRDTINPNVVGAGFVVRNKLLGSAPTPVLKPRRPIAKKKFSPTGRGGGGKW